MRIQHNIMAMNAYRNYNNNTKALSGNLEKLSSGYKINRAGDDAAGLAISEKMRAQITGLDAAQKNVKDGISLVKTAEGAMQEIQDMLNRMDYLATQSANGTYDDEVDRLNLQKEVDALKSEINRIADSANFNGIKLLDGSLATSAADAAASNGAAADAANQVKELAVVKSDANCQVGYLEHKEGVQATKASFEVNLKEALSVANAKASLAATSKVSLTVTIGTVAVKVNVTVGTAVKNGGAINLKTVSFASVTSGSSVTFGTGSTAYKFSVSVDANGKLTFTAKASQAAIDFDAAKAVKIEATKVGFSLKDSNNSTSYDCYTQNIKNGYAAKGTQLAHAHVEITNDIVQAMFGENGKNGAKLKIDDFEISFDAENTTTATGGKTVGIKDLMKKADDWTAENGKMVLDFSDEKVKKEIMARISKAATGNKAFHVGVNGTTLTLQEKTSLYDPNGANGASKKEEDLLDSFDKIQDKISCEGKALSNGGGGTTTAGALKLQIGDTSDDFNQLEVKIGNMHVTAMHALQRDADGNLVKDSDGNTVNSTDTIDGVDISSQDGAKKAVQVIKDAINYVSGVRGDLGAIQNRLDHTANNLSVMAENIQDAESTIRDTDVADEMMKYVKNNILVQSAQAMLAQANQVPQGVLQLLG